MPGSMISYDKRMPFEANLRDAMWSFLHDTQAFRACPTDVSHRHSGISRHVFLKCPVRSLASRRRKNKVGHFISTSAVDFQEHSYQQTPDSRASTINKINTAELQILHHTFHQQVLIVSKTFRGPTSVSSYRPYILNVSVSL